MFTFFSRYGFVGMVDSRPDGFCRHFLKPYRHISCLLHVSSSGQLLRNPGFLHKSLVLGFPGLLKPCYKLSRKCCCALHAMDHKVSSYANYLRKADDLEAEATPVVRRRDETQDEIELQQIL
eukprot:gnl/MRDRNA2_/MRDRNA2_62768_c0_seq2.p1 gnl/MRDRNA2_/MRDRNA2_62768_c0~~gnl/MRDRNA2_/MRDRNA2_62768_c0_seq2.p1  ORF type:complete len:122 (-),score=10.45 gnl/MRDRNA2_/MRDRNA2_62768_c0_seq2:45-410(-)